MPDPMSNNSYTHDDRQVQTMNRQHHGQRRRTAIACARCRRRKIKCSGDPEDGSGCLNCRQSGHAANCYFTRVGCKRYIAWPPTGQNLSEYAQGHSAFDFNPMIETLPTSSPPCFPSTSVSNTTNQGNTSSKFCNSYQLSPLTVQSGQHVMHNSGIPFPTDTSDVDYRRTTAESSLPTNIAGSSYPPNGPYTAVSNVEQSKGFPTSGLFSSNMTENGRHLPAPHSLGPMKTEHNFAASNGVLRPLGYDTQSSYDVQFHKEETQSSYGRNLPLPVQDGPSVFPCASDHPFGNHPNTDEQHIQSYCPPYISQQVTSTTNMSDREPTFSSMPQLPPLNGGLVQSDLADSCFEPQFGNYGMLEDSSYATTLQNDIQSLQGEHTLVSGRSYVSPYDQSHKHTATGSSELNEVQNILPNSAQEHQLLTTRGSRPAQLPENR